MSEVKRLVTKLVKTMITCILSLMSRHFLGLGEEEADIEECQVLRGGLSTGRVW